MLSPHRSSKEILDRARERHEGHRPFSLPFRKFVAEMLDHHYTRYVYDGVSSGSSLKV